MSEEPKPPAEPPNPPPKGTIMLSFPPEEQAGDRIGHYKLLQKLGEGGCGVVYMAEQEVPVRRRVALKVIKLGMDTRQVTARFEAERQALAMMDHPNIAKVLDAGATETGRPFFVMELVRGIRITDYCDQNKLSTPERLRLFIQVCNAIQHAHQKGIIHRDIKPSNILVTLHDGVPVPKVIDFGIAKATQGRLTDQTLFTAFEQFIGTPAYMSPEQAEMSGLDVDTRSDIYALGVLLYELLTGRTPFDAKELLRVGIDELRRTIREEEPERPSTRLSSMMNDELTAAAQRRKLEAPKLIHLLRGDLDWIVMKALEKDRTRRYESANGFAEDVQRYLDNEAVLARPPSTMYRFQKLVRRNKLAVTAGAAVVVALALGFGFSTYLFIQERQARKRADEAERVQRQLAREAEEGRRLEAEKRKNAQLGEKLGLASLYLSQGKFDDAEREAHQIERSLLTNFVASASIYNVIGERHARRGAWNSALSNFSLVVDIAPTNFEGYHALAPLLVHAEDVKSYRRLSERMIKQFSAATDPAVAVRLARGCLLVPPLAASDLEALSAVLDRVLGTVAADQQWPEIHFTKGLLEYRRGNFAEALTWLRKAEGGSERDRYVKAQSQLTLALALNQLQRGNEAAAAIAAMAADPRSPRFGYEVLSGRWIDWILVQALMREVEAAMPASASILKAPPKDPPWLAALREQGFTVDAQLMEDETWHVQMNDQPIKDLSPLRGAPISRLFLIRTPVSDLGPLQGMPLKALQVGYSQVSDLSPLAGMKLRTLQISGTRVADISVLRGMPLEDLKMTGCTNITDLRPLAGMYTLHTLIIPSNSVGFEFLRGIEGLARVSFRYEDGIRGGVDTAANFWAEFDRAQAAQKAAR